MQTLRTMGATRSSTVASLAANDSTNSDAVGPDQLSQPERRLAHSKPSFAFREDR